MSIGNLMAATAIGLTMALSGAALAVEPVRQQDRQQQTSQQDDATIKQASDRLEQAAKDLKAAAKTLREAEGDVADGDVAELRRALDDLDEAVAQMETHQTTLDEAQRDRLGDLRAALQEREQKLEQSPKEAAAAFDDLAEQGQRLAHETGGRYQAAQGDPDRPASSESGNAETEQTAPRAQGSDMDREAGSDVDPGDMPPKTGTANRRQGTGETGVSGSQQDTAEKPAATGQAATEDEAKPGASDQGGQTTAQPSPGAAPAEPQWYSAMRADELIGKEVRSQEGDDISEVERLVFDPDGEAYAVLSVGGFLGIGAKEVLVPLSRFTLSQDNEALTIAASEDELKAMPAYDEARSDYSEAPADRPLGE